MEDLQLKLKKLIADLNAFDDKAVNEKYFLDVRCLILLIHLYVEHFLNRLTIEKRYARTPETMTFAAKIKKLRADGTLDEQLSMELDQLNNARNAIAHKLNITGELTGFDADYVNMNWLKSNAAQLIIKVAEKIRKD